MNLHSNGLFWIWTASGSIDHPRMACFAFLARSKNAHSRCDAHFVSDSKSVEANAMEDWLLIIQCKRGNAKALDRIYRKYKKDCLLLAMALLNDGHAADDIWHDVFVGFAQSIPNFHFKGQLRGYLMTCVANRARNYLKSQKRVLKPEAMRIAREDSADPLDGLILNEQTRQLANALGQLPDKQREVILLHMHGKMTFAMIAHELGVSRNTAKSRYRYGLDRLQTIFSAEVEP